jgi:cysteinyl-tRNA synthetase, unknown class
MTRRFIQSFVVFCIAIIVISCGGNESDEVIPNLDFRQEMRMFVQGISEYSKSQTSNFLIIPQNGVELITLSGEASGTLADDYVNAIDAVGREDLFYGYIDDDIATPVEDRDQTISICDLAKVNGKQVLVTDYCFTQSKMSDSYAQNQTKDYVSFAANHRELDNIPSFPSPIHNETVSDITTIQEAQNFLYLINSAEFSSKQLFIDAIKATNYDVVLIDLFFNDESFTPTEITSLKTKQNGGDRLVICYMSIGEAEDYRYYWNSLDSKLVYQLNPDWPGNYVIKYWESSWQSIIYGNGASYTKKILNAGFDGVYLDIIEAYESFE